MATPRDGLARLRAWWMERQGLASTSAPKNIADCIRTAGWLASSSSTGIYLSIRARMAGVSRAAIDRAAIDGTDIIEVPGAHGRPNVVAPTEETTLALRLNLTSYEKHLAPLFANGRLDQTALKAVAAQVCRALDEGPLSLRDIRMVVTHSDAEELLGVAVNVLALRGVLRRYAVDGRLDTSKYLYELRHPDDRPDLGGEGDTATIALKATRVFLRRHGPAIVDEIAWWSAMTKREVRTALAALRAESISIRGWTDEAWLLPGDVRAWKSFVPRAEDRQRVVLLPYRDPFVHVRRPVVALARSGSVPVLDAKSRRVAIRSVDSLNHHAIVRAGELVGVWEFDPNIHRVVTYLWSADKGLGRAVAAAAADTGEFIRRQLGDAKLAAVDPPWRRDTRIRFCRR